MDILLCKKFIALTLLSSTNNQTAMEFTLEGQDFIELNKLLKLMGLVDTGGEAKQVIEMGQVKVNEQVEFRKRNKLRSGDKVEFDGKMVRVI
jgi:ribosome-associated protein